MSFQFGNKGFDVKIWDTPEKLQEDIDAYFDWCDNNPIEKVEIHGKDAEECIIKLQRPYTVEGLCQWLGIVRRTLLNYHKEESHAEYNDIVDKAKEKITRQKLEYGHLGMFNHNIVKFDLTNNSSYKDKQEVDQNVNLKDFEVGFKTKE